MPDSTLFGRFVSGNSPVHRMDARAKLLLSLALMVVVFCAQTFAALGLCALFVGGFYLLSDISPKSALRSIAPLAFIVVATALLNLFFVQGGQVYFQWEFLAISQAGVRSAVFLSLRLLLLLLGTSLLTLTTPTLDITDAFESLLKPFTRFGLPAHELAMMMGIALRFLPQFAHELTVIYRAQISRGAKLATSGVRGSFAMMTSLLIPLFTSAFRHAETLSAAMDARCYHGGAGRTHLRPLVFSTLDARGCGAVAMLLAGVVALNLAPLP